MRTAFRGFPTNGPERIASAYRSSDIKTILLHVWERLRTSYWFVPGVLSVGAVGLAWLMLWLDQTLFTSEFESQWLYTGSAEGAREVLSTVASSIITVTGVVFSITIAALVQASSQFGPRVLRSFMRDRGNQLTLGVFIATFIYSILVLRNIYGRQDDDFVPHLATSVGVLLTLVSLAMLIFFIHHLAKSLQAPVLVANLAHELASLIDEISSGHDERPEPAQQPQPNWDDSQVAPIRARRNGYIQAINHQKLLRIAHENDLVIRTKYRAGHWMIAGNLLAQVWPAERCTPEIQRDCGRAFLLGGYRTPEQDIEYVIGQIAEVAVRALSPGINDPFTATNCVDALAGCLCRAAHQELAQSVHRDSDGQARVLTRTSKFEGLADAAFTLIRQYGRSHPAVSIRMLEAIAACGSQLTRPEQIQVLLQHARLIHADAIAVTANESDRHDIEETYRHTAATLQPDRGTSQ